MMRAAIQVLWAGFRSPLQDIDPETHDPYPGVGRLTPHRAIHIIPKPPELPETNP